MSSRRSFCALAIFFAIAYSEPQARAGTGKIQKLICSNLLLFNKSDWNHKIHLIIDSLALDEAGERPDTWALEALLRSQVGQTPSTQLFDLFFTNATRLRSALSWLPDQAPGDRTPSSNYLQTLLTRNFEAWIALAREGQVDPAFVESMTFMQLRVREIVELADQWQSSVPRRFLEETLSDGLAGPLLQFGLSPNEYQYSGCNPAGAVSQFNYMMSPVLECTWLGIYSPIRQVFEPLDNAFKAIKPYIPQTPDDNGWTSTYTPDKRLSAIAQYAAKAKVLALYAEYAFFAAYQIPETGRLPEGKTMQIPFPHFLQWLETIALDLALSLVQWQSWNPAQVPMSIQSIDRIYQSHLSAALKNYGKVVFTQKIAQIQDPNRLTGAFFRELDEVAKKELQALQRPPF